ncbi:hypothetical protein [Bradyrhizobium iriomotense]|uniref:Uncharacterized protein n=1 Tax=Bradyrhizobium iriomotense TaxID=441950 RepID=A0ABQ6B2H0_9BRAD|nr:hypothetical protein [Bradyrhizobium iriomotense]GLR87619.1 hypothetical protein GCM10007857_43300 [Bradyrhizobium iriomotense]
MRDNTGLESRTVEAIRHYRKALALVEHLEREDACAHRALTSTLVDLSRAIRDEAAPHLNDRLFEIAAAAASRSDKTWSAMVEATAKLESARLTLAALEQQLGYIPKVALGSAHE